LAYSVITHAVSTRDLASKNLSSEARDSGRLMRFLVRFAPAQGRREDFLRVVRTLSKYLGARTVNAKWTSYGALEVDVFVEKPAELEVLLAAVEPLAEAEFARSLDEAPAHRSKQEIIAESVAYFNGERFFESHEELERLWRTAHGPERELLQGLILVCAALVHEQKGERTVGLGIVRRALPKLAWGGGEYHGIDVARVKRRLEAALAEGSLTVFRI
jgi:uncharacterized protein